MRGDGRGPEVEPLEHQRHDVPLAVQRGLDLAAQPVARLATAFQGRRGEQDEEVSAASDVLQDPALEVAAGDPLEVEEDVVTVLRQVLVDVQRPSQVRAAVAEEDGLLDSVHQRRQARPGRMWSKFNSRMALPMQSWVSPGAARRSTGSINVW